MIVAQGTINTAAQLVPDLYVQIIPPQTYLIPGTQTNVIGVVGTASWGPVNQPVIGYDMPSYVRAFGTPVARKFDMGTQVATAVLQGANNFRWVRVSDGSDAAATSTGVPTCITFTALYTGSLGNNLTVALSTGSKASTWKAIVGVPGGQPEVFDNIAGTGNAFWVNLAAAINSGNGSLRGPSRLVVATAAAGTTAPSAGTYTFSGGADGASSMTSTMLVGVESTTRTGLYALRAQGCSLCVPADLDDSTKWTIADQFAASEGLYVILTTPSGDTIASAISAKQTAGLDDWSCKLMMGDWVLWSDPFAQISRYVSPQGFVAGRLANLSPEQSSLNKPLYGIAGTQRSASSAATYSSAELLLLETAGIDVITNPGGGGLAIWTCRIGHNASSNQATSGDNYTRMTTFIAMSLNAGMGLYLGRPINQSLARDVSATLNSFFMGMKGQGLLGQDYDDGGNPWSVVCGIGPNTNNPPGRVKLGFFQVDVQVQYQAINEKFLINLEGGQTVSIARQTLPTGQVTV